jgi:hypothetical protein
MQCTQQLPMTSIHLAPFDCYQCSVAELQLG